MRSKLVVGLVLVFAAAWAWIALRPSPEERWAELVAELRARGEPVSLAEMEPPMPPDDQNGALDLDAAMAWWEANEPEDGWESRTAGPWNNTLRDGYADASPEQLTALRDLLELQAPFFERVDRGVEKPEIAWALPPRETAEEIEKLWEMVPVIQELQQILSARASCAATEPDRRRAIRSTLLLASRLRARIVLDHLIAATLHAGACHSIREALADGRIDPARARATLADALGVRWDARFPAAVRGERAHVLDTIPFWLDGSMRAALGLPEPRSALQQFLRGVRRLAKGRDFGEPGSPAAMIGWARELERFLEPGLTEEQTWDVLTGLDDNALAILLPRIREKLVEADVQSALARIALAAHEHRRLHGAWPATSRDLAPLFTEGVPLDASTGAPFELAVVDDVLLLRTQPMRGTLDPDEDPFEMGYEWRLPVIHNAAPAGVSPTRER